MTRRLCYTSALATELMEHLRQPVLHNELCREHAWPGAETGATRRRARPHVLLIAPEDAIGELVRTQLGKQPLDVFGPVDLGRASQAVGQVAHFDAALVDVDAGEAVYDIVWQLNEAATPCRSVVIGSHIDPPCVREAFLVGVVACLRKPVVQSMLDDAVRRAVDATTMMRRCIHALAEESPADAVGRPRIDPSVLTEREQEILELLLEGRSTKKMAERLGVSSRTVKFHMSNMLRKLGAQSRLSLLARLRRDNNW